MVNGHALGPEDEKIRRFAVDESDASLRRDQFGEVGDEAANRRRREDESGAAQTERCDLRRKRLFVVDDMVGAHVLRPLHGLWPGGGRDDRQIGQLPRQLNGDRADASSAAEDQDRPRRARNGLRDVEAVKHRLPGRDRRQGQSRRRSEIERARLAADDPLVDQMKLHVRALAADAAGVEHFIARLEELRLAPGLRNHSGGVVADNLDAVRVRGPAARAPAARDLVVDRIDRHRAHLDKKIAALPASAAECRTPPDGRVPDSLCGNRSPAFCFASACQAARSLVGASALGERGRNSIG